MSENGTLTVGNVIKATLTAALNSMVSFIENTVNSSIGLINNITSTIGATTNKNIGKLNNINLPRFATGGYIPAQGTQGGIMAMVGDIPKSQGGEYVLREDQLRGLLEENSINTARAISSLNYNGNNGPEKIDVNLNMDGERLLNKLVNLSKNRQQITGNQII